MDSTTSLLSTNTSSTANASSVELFGRRDNGVDSNAFSSQLQEQYQQQSQTFADNSSRKQESWSDLRENPSPPASQHQLDETPSAWDENVKNNRQNVATNDTKATDVTESTKKTEKPEEKNISEQKNERVMSPLFNLLAEATIVKQPVDKKTAVKETRNTAINIITDPNAKKDPAATIQTDKTPAKTKNSQEKLSPATEKAETAAVNTANTERNSKTAQTTITEIKSESNKTQTAQNTTTVAASVIMQNAPSEKPVTAPRPSMAKVEENDFTGGKELENISGIKINRISSGNTLASQAGKNNNNANTDGSGSDNKNLLQSLADKSSHLQQKLQSQSATQSNSSPETNSTRNIIQTATKSGETASSEKNKIFTSTQNDKNPLSGLDLLRRNDVGSIMKEAQLNPTSASALTERIAGVQQMAEKISETLSGQDNIKSQGITLDFESESMGRMQMYLQQKGNSVKIVFEPGSESCRQQLQDQQQDLARELRNLGYDNLSLDISDKRQQNNGQQQEKYSASGNHDVDNVKLAGDDQSDLAQLLSV